MKTEFECRFLDINIEEMRGKLAAAGFTCTQTEVLQKRAIFNIPNIEGYSQWLRLRDEGSKITLTLKRKSTGVKDVASLGEIEVPVGDFESVRQILNAAGLVNNPLEENKREKWERGNVEVCLDTWPALNPFAEIESDNEESVKSCTKELGFDWDMAEFGNVAEVYEKLMGLSLEDFQSCCNFANPPKSKK